MPMLINPVLPKGALAAREQPELAGNGLVLRPWNAGDAGAVLAAFSDPAIQRWHCRAMESAAEAAQWISRWPDEWAAERAARWGVTEGGVVLGQIGLTHLDLFDGNAEISYWVLPEARGKGVAPRALGLLSEWVFGDLGLARLELEHSVHNLPSCRVAEKAGFRAEGIKRSSVVHQDGRHDMELHAKVATDTP